MIKLFRLHNGLIEILFLNDVTMVSKQYHDYDTDDVNLEDFSRLVDKQSDALRQLECDLEKLEQRRAEYSSVKDRLKEVSGKLRCPTMVPLSKVNQFL